jgi:hypothetical protein
MDKFTRRSDVASRVGHICSNPNRRSSPRGTELSKRDDVTRSFEPGSAREAPTGILPGARRGGGHPHQPIVRKSSQSFRDVRCLGPKRAAEAGRGAVCPIQGSSPRRPSSHGEAGDLEDSIRPLGHNGGWPRPTPSFVRDRATSCRSLTDCSTCSFRLPSRARLARTTRRSSVSRSASPAPFPSNRATVGSF